jgi:pimeloyl-ACP methyl ester carboxylesterase
VRLTWASLPVIIASGAIRAAVLIRFGLVAEMVSAVVDHDAANPISDDELRSLRMPMLVLFGDGEVIYDPAKALDRARRLIPHFEGELIPHCRHDMCSSQSGVVDARVLDFLKNRGGPQAGTELRSVA